MSNITYAPMMCAPGQMHGWYCAPPLARVIQIAHVQVSHTCTYAHTCRHKHTHPHPPHPPSTLTIQCSIVLVVLCHCSVGTVVRTTISRHGRRKRP